MEEMWWGKVGRCLRLQPWAELQDSVPLIQEEAPHFSVFIPVSNTALQDPLWEVGGAGPPLL